MLSKLLIRTAVARIHNHKKFKAIKRKRKKKRDNRKYMYNTFGKLRCVLAKWLGSWVLFAGNKKFYECRREDTKEEV